MNQTILKKIQAHTAAEVCQHFTLGEEARALLREEHTPEEFLELLAEHEQFTDATRLLAYGLPKRDAVWWACLCVRQGTDPKPASGELMALQVVERWVVDPCEKNRRAAMQVAEALAFQNAASWTAMAAFWSGGSMAPAEAPMVPAGEYLTAQAVTGAVLLAAVQCPPGAYMDTCRTFLAEGTAVTIGMRPWSINTEHQGVEP